MEDNNAISEQGLLELNEENFNKLQEENAKLTEAINALYMKAKQLENTWILTRASMLMDIVKCGKFDTQTTVEAMNKITNFLFPKKETEDKE